MSVDQRAAVNPDDNRPRQIVVSSMNVGFDFKAANSFVSVRRHFRFQFGGCQIRRQSESGQSRRRHADHPTPIEFSSHFDSPEVKSHSA